MFFDFALTVPVNTPELTPYEVELPLAHGIIHHVEVGFPPGPKRTTFCQLHRGLHQVWPNNIGGAFGWDNFTLVWGDWYEMEDYPYMLTARLWNTSTLYDHLVVVRIGILPREVLIPPREEALTIRRIGEMIFGKRK